MGEAKQDGSAAAPHSQAPQPGCIHLPGGGGKANDSLSQPLVTPPRHVIPCRTGATCSVAAPLLLWMGNAAQGPRDQDKRIIHLSTPGPHKTTRDQGDLPWKGVCGHTPFYAKIPPHGSYIHQTCRYLWLHTHGLIDV